MCDEAFPYDSRIDITVEFYHKTAIYNSPITGAKVPINIKTVESISRRGKSWIVVRSDKDNNYLVDELTFPIDKVW